MRCRIAARKGQWLYGKEPLTRPIPLSLSGIVKAYDQQVRQIARRTIDTEAFLQELYKAWQDCINKRDRPPADEGMWLFHFWGTLWGRLLTEVLVANRLIAEPANEYCLFVRPSITQLPPWDEKLARKVAMTTALALAERLEMGRFHSLLPANVGVAAVIRLLNLKQFGELYRAASVVSRPEIYEPLHILAL
jgi:hypothetical protein